MPFGPFALQWRAPSPNPPGITRSYISTPSGPHELLSAEPHDSQAARPALFFAHGGFGCAEIWLDYMIYCSAANYPCYAISYRGHGKSWYPGFWSMYFTSREIMAQDLVAGVKEVGRLETERRKANEKDRIVLVAHSAGGASSQYALSRGLLTVQGFCMLAAVPAFGSLFIMCYYQYGWSVYKFWSLTAPMHFPYRLFHPRYILATTQQVRDAFFTPMTTPSVVIHLESLLSPYESMLWPMQALFLFVTGPDVVRSIVGWIPRKLSDFDESHLVAPRFLVLAGELDVRCTPSILKDAADNYNTAFHHCVKSGKLDGISESDISAGYRGVDFHVAKGQGHHLQNDVGWQLGATRLLLWADKL